MALKTFVKISGVNNLSDARYCAGMGVDMIGFTIDPGNEKYVSPENYREITEWLSGVKFVGECYESSAAVVEKLHNDYHPDYLQITNPTDIAPLKLLGTPLLLRISTGTIKDKDTLAQFFEKFYSDVVYFLVENDEDNYEEQILDWVLDLSKKYPILLGFGINENNIMELINTSSIEGITLRGGEEIKPGYKDFDELADILEALEIDDLDI